MRTSTMTRIMVPLAILAIGFSSNALAGGDINFILGQKQLDEEQWGQASDQGEFGILASFGGEKWPVDIATDMIFSGHTFQVPGEDSPVELFSMTFELDLGVRKIWEHGKARPFVGGGLAIIAADIELAVGEISVGTDANGPGVWVDGGIFWRLTRHFNLGLESRISRAKVDNLFGSEVEAGGEHFGLLLGCGW
jgi:hypothetical protein